MKFWRDLSERERILIKIAGGLAVLLVVIQLIVSPVFKWRAEQVRSIGDAENLYGLVVEAAAQSSVGVANGADVETPVRNIVTTTAANYGVELVYVNSRADGVVDVNAAMVEPQALFNWLQAIEQDFGVQVVTADLARENTQPQLIRTQISFARSGR